MKVLAVAAALIAQAGLTGEQVVARIIESAKVPVKSTSVDTFKAGDPSSRVTGIAVTMMATLDVLKRAVAKGDNLIITHEPTFYSHRDTTGSLERENDAVLAAKQKFIRDNKLMIWRFHDIPHAMQPDIINAGIVDALGWRRYADSGSTQIFTVPSIPLNLLARSINKNLGGAWPRISGNATARVSKVVITQGFWGFSQNRPLIQKANPDLVIVGEDHEWETIEYVADAISAGRIKGLIVLGHIPSEQAGMEKVAQWLKTILPEVRIDFVPTKDFFLNAGLR